MAYTRQVLFLPAHAQREKNGKGGGAGRSHSSFAWMATCAAGACVIGGGAVGRLTAWKQLYEVFRCKYIGNLGI